MPANRRAVYIYREDGYRIDMRAADRALKGQDATPADVIRRALDALDEIEKTTENQEAGA